LFCQNRAIILVQPV